MESGDFGDSTLAPENSTKPYLLRAIYDWSLDNGFTPQILVAADRDEVAVPLQYVQDNRIVLNIHPQSVKEFQLENDYLWFSARFSGSSFQVTVPISAVLAIYARENGQGIVFQSGIGSASPDDSGSDGSGRNSKPSKSSKPKADSVSKKLPDSRSHLKLVK